MNRQRRDSSPTVAEQFGGEVAPRRWSLTGPLRFPGDIGKCAPPRILVAKGRAVASDADSAIARALAVREQLDREKLDRQELYRYPERPPVIAKTWRLIKMDKPQGTSQSQSTKPGESPERFHTVKFNGPDGDKELERG
jgi:hypothetical protein